MQKYSVFSLIKNAFSNHEKWDLAWKDPSPKKEYNVIIIGGGGYLICLIKKQFKFIFEALDIVFMQL